MCVFCFIGLLHTSCAMKPQFTYAISISHSRCDVREQPALARGFRRCAAAR